MLRRQTTQVNEKRNIKSGNILGSWRPESGITQNSSVAQIKSMPISPYKSNNKI